LEGEAVKRHEESLFQKIKNCAFLEETFKIKIENNQKRTKRFI